jgi:hypothetical protein
MQEKTVDAEVEAVLVRVLYLHVDVAVLVAAVVDV